MSFDRLKRILIKFNETDFRELVLSGVNIGEYKASTGEKFIDVANLIDDLDLNFRARISSIEPNLISDDLIKVVKSSDSFCKHFHIPLQSGSPKILRLMRRRYTAEDFKEGVLKIKEEIPDCSVGADVIEGFPGETDDDFAETYNLLETAPVSYLHVFTYSERNGTPAAEFPNPVHSKIRKDRTSTLRKLSDQKKDVFYKSQLGKQRIVIPEKIVEENGKKYLKGWTDNYVKILFADESFRFNPALVKIKSLGANCAFGERIKSISAE